jgi:hypothetical protein
MALVFQLNRRELRRSRRGRQTNDSPGTAQHSVKWRGSEGSSTLLSTMLSFAKSHDWKTRGRFVPSQVRRSRKAEPSLGDRITSFDMSDAQVCRG